MSFKALSRWIFSALLALGVSATCALTAPADPSFPTLLLSETTGTSQDIGTRMGYLVDGSRAAKLEQVRLPGQAWQTIDRTSPNFGFTDKAYWFRFVINNPTDKPQQRLLELPRPFLDDVRLFHLVAGEVQTRYALGDEQPFAQRVVQHQNFVMPLTLVPGPQEIYLRLASSGTIEAPLRLWEPAAFFEAAAREHLLAGAVLGILVVMIVYNLFVFLATRDVNYLYYIAFVSSYLLFWATLWGYAFAYLWPNEIRWNSEAVPVFIATACISACLFASSFLKLRRFSKTAYWSVQTLAWVNGGLLLTSFYIPYELIIRVNSVMILTVAVVALGIGYWRWWKGARFARFYCLAWTSVLVGVCVLTIGKFGILPANFWTENASQIGALMLVILLSFTLADRINTDRSLRIDAQAIALAHARKARESQRALIESTAQANRELESRVRDRTDELNEALSKLQTVNAELQRLSHTDGLTQVGNRAYFDLALASEHKRASRLKQPLALMLFDIDHFKSVNDTWGHPAGDACLRYLAEYMRQKVQRAGDVLARYGGEEFVVLLINSTLGDALELAEEFREDIAGLAIPIEGQSLRITASFGVASAIPDASTTPATLVADADKALYEAKHGGRNCVRAAAPRLPV
ncbi:7TM diverse intracellular signaling domain-containing protein [Rhodoferax saidenbachensis]|uniref:diguanylate cyclase n=1 Tax=Rhodoferax saidenbachensis TaxID=1484693 RepID=A0ABU1ZM98_9BURK|nr:7TM diverse intracellular signaling domain-containing protein [Rhodoferax saidenbachensis]MDR7306679.1 diguanylate cyclase [Rhodoferax saidenbachensis]